MRATGWTPPRWTSLVAASAGSRDLAAHTANVRARDPCRSGQRAPVPVGGRRPVRPGPPPSLTSQTYLKALGEVPPSAPRRAPSEPGPDRHRPVLGARLQRPLRPGPARRIGRRSIVRWLAGPLRSGVQRDHDRRTDRDLQRKVRVHVLASGHGHPDRQRRSRPELDPLFATPRHPEYPSGHGGYAGAAQEVLQAFLGPFAPTPISVTSPTDPGSTHTYRRWSTITQENVDGRVWRESTTASRTSLALRSVARSPRYDLRRLQTIGLGEPIGSSRPGGLRARGGGPSAPVGQWPAQRG